MIVTLHGGAEAKIHESSTFIGTWRFDFFLTKEMNKIYISEPAMSKNGYVDFGLEIKKGEKDIIIKVLGYETDGWEY